MNKAGRQYRPYYGKRKNVGCYQQPFSGVGMEFAPLGAAPSDVGFVLHETGYWPRNCAWNYPNTYSPFWRIYFDYATGHHVRFGDELTPLGPDRVLVIPNHQRFDSVGDEPVPSLWFTCSCRRSADTHLPMPIEIPANDAIAAFADEFPPLFRRRSADKRERIYQLSLSFVLYVLGRPQVRWQNPLPEHFAAVVAMIDDNPAGPWGSAVLAKEANMSVDGFARGFRQWMRTTPSRYVQQVRVREACRLLTTTNESIKRVALQVGFANRHHFSRVFKAHTGDSPAHYRVNHSVSAITGSIGSG